MNIFRHGSYRYRGTKGLLYVPIEKPRGHELVKWDKNRQSLRITSRAVPNDSGDTHHTYIIELTLDDISALIKTFAHVATNQESAVLRKHLKGSTQDLIKLLALASGLEIELNRVES